jgi:hypothetical protein
MSVTISVAEAKGAIESGAGWTLEEETGCWLWDQPAERTGYGPYLAFYEASVWGIIDPDRTYGKECMRDMAEDVAAQMEVDGYTVTDKPPKPTLKSGYPIDGYRRELKRKLYLDCWNGDARLRHGRRASASYANFGDWYETTEAQRTGDPTLVAKSLARLERGE